MDHHFSMRPRCTPSPFSPHLTNTFAGIRVNFPLALQPLKFSFSNNIAGYLSVGCGSPINDNKKLISAQLFLFDVEPCFNLLTEFQIRYLLKSLLPQTLPKQELTELRVAEIIGAQPLTH